MAWPKGKPRGKRAALAPEQGTSIDEPQAAPQPTAVLRPPPTRAPAPKPPAAKAAPGSIVGTSSGGRVVALGRDGERLTRQRVTNSDMFYIDPKWIPQGFDWQWNVYEVLGQPQVAQQLGMAENGWRPVTADRLPGVFMPAGYEGPILRDGLRLEERPMILTQEAKAEELAKARRQVSDQQEQLMLSKKGALGDGFSDNPKYRGVGATVRSTIAPAPDIPRPQLEIDPSA